MMRSYGFPVFRSSSPADPFVGEIVISTPTDYQPHQRNVATNQADIPIVGTYNITSGSLSGGIEASFNGGAYQTIVASPSGGTFSGTLTAQGKGQGTLTVRFVNAPSSNGTKAFVGVSALRGNNGQSNSIGGGAGYTAPAAPAAHPGWVSVEYDMRGYWREHTESIAFPYFDCSGGGALPRYSTTTAFASCWGAYATIFMDEEDCPIAFVPMGYGSVFLNDGIFGCLALGGGSGATPSDTATLFGCMKNRVAAVGGVLEGLDFVQGESECNGSGTPGSWATYMDTYIADARTNVQSNLNFVIAAIPHATNGTSWSTVYAQQLSMVGHTGVTGVADLESPTPCWTGDIHPQTSGELQAFARRMKDVAYP